MQIEYSSLYIVLIEPSIAQSKIVLQQFSDLGITQYNLVRNGKDALDIIESDPPDLVISSLYLEDMTGSDLVQAMRKNAETINTPFILISTAKSFEDLEPIKQAGASVVLSKPFDVNDLKRAIVTTMNWEHPDLIELEDFDLDTMDILVVDDSSLARKMICRTLGKMGFKQIIEAGDGSEAIPLIQQQHFDLVVTDYNMPEVDGHELLRYIRNESNQSSVPVMMVTTEGDERKLTAVQQAGVSAIVDKPFEVASVKKILESALTMH